MKDGVTVYCLTYNHKEYIEKTLEGFVNQNVSFPYKVIVHDDASTDGTQEIILQYAKKYPKIIFPILQNENQYYKIMGIYVNFIRPLIETKYTAICEGDDYWIDPMKIQIQVDYMDNHPDCGMTRTDVNVLYDKNGILKHNVFENGDFPNCKNTFIDYILYGYWSATCTWMIRRNLDIYYPLPPDCFNGDLAIMIKVIKVSDVKYISQSTAVYRVLEESASHINNKEKAFSFWRSQVNTRCYFAKTIPLKFKFMLIKHLTMF